MTDIAFPEIEARLLEVINEPSLWRNGGMTSRQIAKAAKAPLVVIDCLLTEYHCGGLGPAWQNPLTRLWQSLAGSRSTAGEGGRATAGGMLRQP